MLSGRGPAEDLDETIAVMIVDDEPTVLRVWQRILAGPRYRVALYRDPHEADARCEALSPDVAVVDIRMPGMSGMELLTRLKSRCPQVEVVMMTGYGGIEDAVEAMKRGAYDFLTKPFASNEAAELVVRRAAKVRRLERRVLQLEQQMDSRSETRLIGRSPAIRRVLELMRSIASSPANVLICGESGTGKELVARSIHEGSARGRAPFVAVNCAALPEALLESELFGHVKGAFTGASAAHQGLFSAADGGSIFLDEIGDMALPTQAKLLRALQEGEVRPVGSSELQKVNVRAIAATNVDLEQRCAEGRFREDLYYRLNVIRVDVPPLRERGDDVALLAQHFLHESQQAVERRFDGIEPAALELLSRYDWRGNVRELANVMERAVAVARGATITCADLPPRIARLEAAPAELGAEELPFAEAKRRAVERFERGYLEGLLARSPSVSAAARAAGLDRANLRRLLRRHGICATSSSGRQGR